MPQLLGNTEGILKTETSMHWLYYHFSLKGMNLKQGLNSVPILVLSRSLTLGKLSNFLNFVFFLWELAVYLRGALFKLVEFHTFTKGRSNKCNVLTGVNVIGAILPSLSKSTA